jgi:membrane protease YdiL (CAAX protease family)
VLGETLIQKQLFSLGRQKLSALRKSTLFRPIQIWGFMMNLTANKDHPISSFVDEKRCFPVRQANRSLLALLLAPVIPVLLLGELVKNEWLVVIIANLFSLIFLAAFIWRGNLKSIALLLKPRPFNPFTVLGAFVLGELASTGLILFMAFTTPKLLTTLEGFESSSSLDIILFIIAAVLLAPFIEELVFRGVALSVYSNVATPLFSILFTSLLFGMFHGSISHTIAIFPFGVISALLALKSKQLWPSIIIHALGNFLVLIIPSVSDDRAVNALVGIAGLIVSCGCLLIACYWLKVPNDSVIFSKIRSSIWTPSLVITVIICVISILISTLNVYFPSTT